MICKLQQRWRRNLRISDEHRRARESVEGRLVEDLFKVMEEKWTEPPPSLKSAIITCRIQARKRIFSALPLMVDLENDNTHEPFSLKDGFLLDLSRLRITKTLREKVMCELHAPPYARHHGIQATTQAIETYFY